MKSNEQQSLTFKYLKFEHTQTIPTFQIHHTILSKK